MRLTVPVISHEATSTRTTARLVGPDVDLELWFEVPALWQIERGCAPFVPVATLLATGLGADELIVDGPIETPLADGAQQAAALIAGHYRRRPVRLVVDGRPVAPVVATGRRTGLFFSQGVDSSANLVLADRGELDPRPDLAIIVTGIDPANDDGVEARVVDAGVTAATSFDLDTVVVGTNLRDIIDHHLTWIDGFGQVLAGVGLLLSADLEHAVISSATPSQQHYTGSHPDLDPLWSNGRVQFHHLPDHLERSERVRLIVEDGRALSFLRVCWQGRDDNCGRCKKCLQTAALIDAFGGDAAAVFGRVPSAEDIRITPPGHILRADFIASAPAHLAAAAAEFEAQVPGRAAPRALAAAASAEPNGARSWLAIGEPGPRLAAIVEHGQRHSPGRVLAHGPTLTTHVLRRAASCSGTTVWHTIDGVADADRALACVREGSRPLIVHDDERIEAVRAALPSPLRSLVGRSVDVVAAIDDAAAVIGPLARALAGGGTGWIQAMSAAT